MAISQNGYRANDPGVVSRRPVAGTDVGLTVRTGAPGDLLLHWAAWFDRNVENIDNARGHLDDWGFAERPIRGSTTTLSNHASGTAIDLNATKHPLGKLRRRPSRPGRSQADPRGAREVPRAASGGAGTTTAARTSMHFEIMASEQRCAAMLAKLTAAGGAAAAASTGGAAAPTTGVELMERITVTPPNAGQNTVRLFLPGTPGAAVIVRPRLGKKDAVNPMWVGHIFAWGQNGDGVGQDPAAVPGYDNKLVNHRKYPLAGALWCDLNYSAAEPFEIDIVG
jgi:hypothetical protein